MSALVASSSSSARARAVASRKAALSTRRQVRRPVAARAAASGASDASVSRVDASAASLLPPPTPSTASLVATVAARPATKAPAVASDDVSPFMAFCRANWGYFAALQTIALIGAANNGILAKKRRLEIAEINAKLRAMMQKYEEQQDACDPDGPASRKLSEGKRKLKEDDLDGAVQAFNEAALLVERGDDASALSVAKGVATALIRKGDLAAAIAVLEAKDVVDAAVRDGDGAVYGMLGDCYTDRGEFATAGKYYDKCLSMD